LGLAFNGRRNARSYGGGLPGHPGNVDGCFAVGAEHFGHGVRILDLDGDAKPELTVTAPKEDGTYQSAASWALKITGTGTAASITQATRKDRDTLLGASCTADPTTSCFGPGFPMAGATTGPIELPETGPYVVKPGVTSYLEGFPADQ
jgi:hypothetical protein